MLVPAAPAQRQQVVCGPGHDHSCLALRGMASSDGQQAHSAEPVARVVPGAVVERETRSRSAPGRSTSERTEGVTGGGRAAGTSGEPRHGLGQFRRFGALLQRAEVRCFLVQKTVVGTAVVHLARLMFGHAAPLINWEELGDHLLDDPARTAPNRVQEEPLNWPFTIKARRRVERTVFASRGSGVQIPSAPPEGAGQSVVRPGQYTVQDHLSPRCQRCPSVLDQAASDTHGRQKSTDIGIRRPCVLGALRDHMVWPERLGASGRLTLQDAQFPVAEPQAHGEHRT